MQSLMLPVLENKSVALATRVGMAAAEADYPRNPLESDLFLAAIGDNVDPDYKERLIKGYVKGFDAAKAVL